VTIFGVECDELELEHVRAFLDGAGREPLTWEAKGTTLRSEQVTKYVCGFANAVDGGYVLLGFDRHDAGWRIDGVEFPGDDPPVWVSNVVANTLRPRPRVDVRDWPTSGKKRAAVVQVEPVAEPPCITSDGIVWERVSGATIAVRDAADLRALYGQGAAAAARAEASALRALDEVGVGELPRAVPCVMQLGLSIAPVGTARDIASNLFTRAVDAMLRDVVDTLPVEPLFIDDFPRPAPAYTIPRQDAVIATVLEDRRQQTWQLRAAWDGSVALRVRAIPSRDQQLLMIDEVFEGGVLPMADAVTKVARAIGGHGRAHVVLGIRARQFELMQQGHYPQQIPDPSRLAPIQRWADGVMIDDTVRASMQRELLRATGIPAYED
jgi:hypothetical protein